MRKLLSFGVVVATAAALVAPVVQASPAAAAGTNTTVVLTFDDGVGTQATAAALMKARGMVGTFYVNSNFTGTDSSFLSWAQLTQMQADGNEIGGHSLDHPDLTTLPADQVQAQVCQDRQNLMSHGLTVTSFAYPYGVGYENATVRQVVQQCGYNSARRAWGLYSAAPECGTTGCSYPYADTIPVADAYAVRAGDNPETTTTLAAIEKEVTQAEQNGGGLVPIVFHEICTGCDQYSVTVANFTAFLDWLKLRAPSGTVVKTMAQVIGGPVSPADTTAPTSTIKCNNVTPCSAVGYATTASVTLAATDNAGGSGLSSIRYTTDGTDPTNTSTAYAAAIPVASTTTIKYRAYDVAGNAEAVKSQLVTIDGTAPATTASCNSVACSSGWYSGSVQIGLAASDAGVGVKEIRYTTNGNDPTTGSTLYNGPFAVASTATVKFRAWDNLNNAEAVKSQSVQIDRIAPATELSCNGGACPTSWTNSSVSVSLAATDDGGSGVDSIHYTMDGSTPTLASPLYVAPVSVSSSQNFKFRAWDNAGNEEGVRAQTLAVDKVKPTASIKCNDAACSSAWTKSSVKVALSATDAGGSGVASIHYTTDGSTPTLASTLYGAPLNLSKATTVKYAAFDGAGNQSTVGSAGIRIDKTAPTAAISGPKDHATVKGNVRMSVKVSDSQSKIGKVLFYVDGRLVATDTAPSFTYVWNTSKAGKRHHRLSVKVFDKAGNSTTKAITVTVH